MSAWNQHLDTNFPNASIISVPSTNSLSDNQKAENGAFVFDGQSNQNHILAPDASLTSEAVLTFPNGLYIYNGANLFIKEFEQGLKIETPFIVIERDASLQVGKDEDTLRYATRLEIVLMENKANPQNLGGIDDPQLYSLFEMSGTWSTQKPGFTPAMEPEMQLFGNKVLAVGNGGRLELHGEKGATAWARLGGNIDLDDELLINGVRQKKNRVIIEGDLSKDWKVGDRIVVTTSDFEPDHSEDAEITDIRFASRIGRTQITVKDVRPCVSESNQGGGRDEFQWSHWGQKDPNGEIDIRASVGLLTRNIVITSERDQNAPDQALSARDPQAVTNLESGAYKGVALGLGGNKFWKGNKYPGKFGDKLSNTCNRADIYGGQTMFRRGSRIHISRVEFSYLGQPGNFARIGRYPVHFHMKFNDNLNLPSGERGDYLVNCSIHHSFNRWVTIHGTHGVEIKDNVGYKSFGHGFYIEDGVEQLNVLDGNLGICVRAPLPHLLSGGAPPNQVAAYWNPLDIYPLTIQDRDTPSVFWIANKYNILRNNIAAGAAMGGRGYWLVGTQSTLRQGPSVDMAKRMAMPATPYLEGVNAPLLEFDNNTVHSTWRGIDAASSDGSGILRGGYDMARLYAYDGDSLEAAWMANPEPKRLDGKHVIDIMSRTTCFRNRQYGAWLRPFWWWVTRSNFVDNGFGLSVVSGGNDEAFPPGYWGLVSDCVFVGFSENLYRNQSRAAHSDPVAAIAANQTDFNPTIDKDGLNRSGNIFGSGGGETPGASGNYEHERRGYQFYDGPGPILTNCKFRAFYPTFDHNSNLEFVLTDTKGQTQTINLKNTYPLGATPGNTPDTWADWLGKLEQASTDASNNKAVPRQLYHNAAIGWFGPGNTWKYSALTWVEKLSFNDDDVIIRHMVYDPKNYAGHFGDGDLQTFILDKDGSLQGFTSEKGTPPATFNGSACVNNWPVHLGPDGSWVHECRSAKSCITSPYYYANTDIIVDNVSRENKAMVFGKVQNDFVSKPDRYYIPGQMVKLTRDDAGNLIPNGDLSIYGTLNMTGARYTLQFVKKVTPSPKDPNTFTLDRANPTTVVPPKSFAIYCTSLNKEVGQNKIIYAITYPEDITIANFKLKAMGLEISNETGHTYREGWDKVAKNGTALPVTDSSQKSVVVDVPNVARFQAQFDDKNNLLIITIEQTASRSDLVQPAGIRDWNASAQSGDTDFWDWTNMAHLQEGEFYDMQTVLDKYANSLNLTPAAGSPIVSIDYDDSTDTTKFEQKIPPKDIQNFIPANSSDVFDTALGDIKLKLIQACTL